MRIAVNSRLLVPDKMDGIGRFTYETLKRITQKHPEVTFDLIFDRKAAPVFQFGENVNLINLAPQARHPLLWFIWFEHQLKQWVNKNNYDLFLSPEGWIPPKLTCPSLGVIHDLNFAHHPENIIYSHRAFLQYYFPKYAKRADRIATVSNFSKADIAKTYHIDEEQIDVVYNGANSIFKPLAENKQEEIRKAFSRGKPYFIFIGTIHPRKNIEHLLLAFDRFKTTYSNEVQLLIVGNRKWWPKKLERIYRQMAFGSEVQFLGRQSDELLAKLLASAQALTYLPYFEGFGIPILEAFQSHVPVISSNRSSMPEVAKDAALLTDPRDVEEIAEQMKNINFDKALRNRLIEKGSQRAKDFSWDRSAELLWKSMMKTLG